MFFSQQGWLSMKKILLFSIIIVLLSPLKVSAQYNQQVTTPSSTTIPPPNSSSAQWQVSSSLTYTTGDFGTNTTTDTVYIPVTLTRYFSKGSVDWTIPYVYKKSGPGVTLLEGRPFRTSHQNDGTRTDSGLGDMLLKGSYYLLEEEDSKPLNASLIGQIKFPTADDDKCLGTGEFDETTGIELSKSLNEDWRILTNLYYTFIGDPHGVNLKNEFAFDLGAEYKLNSETWTHFYYEEKTALISHTSNPRAVFIGADYQLDPSINIVGDLGIGLSEGSPDFGITVGAGVKF